ncbi:MAG: hypothetical protein PHQ32_06385 [Firmicutes bacterium]|nr:hypothetical protein [Bacillota bacterium]
MKKHEFFKVTHNIVSGIKTLLTKDIMMMNLEVIKDSFNFLTDEGFKYSFNNDSNIVLSLEYMKNDLVIIPGYDYREHDFSVSLRDLKNKNILNLSTDILDANIGGLTRRNKLIEDISNVKAYYKKFTHGMPKEYFVAITNLYADFIKENIKEIIEWKYSV